MLTAGLFADAPHSQTIVHNFMRLRALRVVVDVNLATGVFSLPEAVDFFVRMVPMDVETATEETAYYVATPGLAMSYLVGKHEVMRLVADAAVAAVARRRRVLAARRARLRVAQRQRADVAAALGAARRPRRRRPARCRGRRGGRRRPDRRSRGGGRRPRR